MEPIIRRQEEMEWVGASLHNSLFQKTLISSEESIKLNLHLWKVLREKIEPGGAVLPHTHDVTEIIHFIEGEVAVLLGENRMHCRPGDAIVAPAGVVHGVANRRKTPSEQISFFIPEIDKKNFGHTRLVPEEKI